MAYYEFRAGTLIPGVLISSQQGVFVPNVGEKVISFKDHDPYKPKLPIYNMHINAMYWTPARAEARSKGLLKQPPPPACGLPKGADLKYEEKQNGKAKYCYVYKEWMSFGILDRTGTFIPDDDLPPIPRTKLPHGVAGQTKTIFFNLPIDGKKTEEAYEYRSGRLIRGTLDDTGNFTPEIGSTIMDFKDFEPLKDRKRIYNLPGRLVPKK
ncbi:MAG TPA: hypothetical protein VGJ05_04055 [Fimbriiglobus sp.]